MRQGHLIKTIWASVILAAVLSGACGGAGSATTPATGDGADPAALSAGDPIPAPSTKPVLTIVGSISETNSGDRVRLDIPTLDKMPQVEATVLEPFLKEDVSFSGVMMDDLLEIVGADPKATGVLMTALDDYEVDLPMSELTSSTVLLATREEGKPIKLQAGGPVRIIFLNEDGLGSNYDSWIWSVERMDVHN